MDKFELKCLDNDTKKYIQQTADGIFHVPLYHNISLICCNDTSNGLYNFVWDSNVEKFDNSGNVDTIFFNKEKQDSDLTGIYSVTVYDLESSQSSKLSTTLFFYKNIQLQLTCILNKKRFILNNGDTLHINFYDKIKVIPSVTNISNLNIEYQWCLNNKIVSNESCYKPKFHGSYTVSVINNGDTHATSCFQVIAKPLAEQILSLLP